MDSGRKDEAMGKEESTAQKGLNDRSGLCKNSATNSE